MRHPFLLTFIAILFFSIAVLSLKNTILAGHADHPHQMTTQSSQENVYPIHSTAGDITVSFHHPVDKDTINAYAQAWNDAITKKDHKPVCTRPMQDTYSTTTKDYTATTRAAIPNDPHAQLAACSHLTAWDHVTTDAAQWNGFNKTLDIVLLVSVGAMFLFVITMM